MSEIENDPSGPVNDAASDETDSAHRPDPGMKRGSRRSTEDDHRYRHTRTSAAWAGVAVAVLFGVALIDFIAQNTRDVRIEFFSLNGRIPIAVALLASALAGAVVVLAIGVGRVAQLRYNMRRQRRRAKADISDDDNDTADGEGRANGS
jgi:uncharacterized integral membrane protein